MCLLYQKLCNHTYTSENVRLASTKQIVGNGKFPNLEISRHFDENCCVIRHLHSFVLFIPF